MSRETVLDDAIAKAKADEDLQLVEWLRMARGAESAARWYSDKLRESHRATRKLLDENAKLHAELTDLRLESCPSCGIKVENEELRELCRHLYACNQYCDREESDGGCSACPYQLLECDCGFEERLLELGIEVDA